jgi:hypothetical protein
MDGYFYQKESNYTGNLLDGKYLKIQFIHCLQLRITCKFFVMFGKCNDMGDFLRHQ